MKRIEQLPLTSCRLLCSGQIISSVYSVVKELIENSLDSACTSVEVKLENSGLDKVEVRDNGQGIHEIDIAFVAKPHCTSKISTHADLEKLQTYGFRGEALGALCSVAELMITTKTKESDISMTYAFDHGGEVLTSRPSASPQGTTVIATNLFKNVPVRRQFYKSEKHKKDELRKIESLMYSFACAQAGVRFSLYHNRNLIWQKSAVNDVRSALIQIFGSSTVNSMSYTDLSDDELQIHIEVFFPKSGATAFTLGQANNDRSIVIVNKRPVRIKEIDKTIQECYLQLIDTNAGRCRYPLCFISITLPPCNIDVNVEPNKTTVLLHNLDRVVSLLSSQIHGLCQSPKNEILPLANFISEESNDGNIEINVHGNNTTENSSSDALYKEMSSFNNSVKNQSMNINFPNITVVRRSDNICVNMETSSQINSNKDAFANPDHISDSLTNVDSSCQNKINKSNEVNSHSCGTLPNSFNRKRASQLCCKTSNEAIILDADKQLFLKQKEIFDVAKNSANNENFENINFANDINVIGSGGNRRKKLSTKSHSAKQNSISTFFRSPTENVNDFRKHQSSGNENHLNSSIDLGSQSKCTPNSGHIIKKMSEKNNSVSRTLLCAIDESHNPSDSNTKEICSITPTHSVNKRNWSRGNYCDSEGETFQPVTVLIPSASKQNVSSTDDKVTQAKRKKCLSEEPNTTAKDTEKEVQFLKHTFKGFSFFCRDHRLETALQYPEFTSQQIALYLTEKWNLLSSDEKSVYEKMVAVDSIPLLKKKKKKLGKTLSQTLNNINQINRKEISPFAKLRSSKTINYKREKMILFNLHDMKSLFSQNSGTVKESTEVSTYSVINSISPGCWICKVDNSLLVLNTFRLQETLIFHRLMENHEITCEKLSVPLVLTESLIGGPQLWKTVLNRETYTDPTGQITLIIDKRITANGFNIKIGPNNKTATVIGMAKYLPLCNISDLQEVLNCLLQKGEFAAVSECRPVKVIHYLEAEAVRIVRQCPLKQEKEDVEQLLHQKESNLPSTCSTCIHNKPIFISLYDMKNIESHFKEHLNEPVV